MKGNLVFHWCLYTNNICKSLFLVSICPDGQTKNPSKFCLVRVFQLVELLGFQWNKAVVAMLILYVSIKMFFKEDCNKEQLNLMVIPFFCTVHHPLHIYKIATSKIVVIFSSHLKRGNKGPFVLLMLLIAILITYPAKKHSKLRAHKAKTSTVTLSFIAFFGCSICG